MREVKKKKKNYSPPGWLVVWWDNVRLDQERAVKFQNFRQRLCDQVDLTDPEDHIDYPFLQQNALWIRALDLLLEQENKLLSEIKEIQKSK